MDLSSLLNASSNSQAQITCLHFITNPCVDLLRVISWLHIKQLLSCMCGGTLSGYDTNMTDTYELCKGYVYNEQV